MITVEQGGKIWSLKEEAIQALAVEETMGGFQLLIFSYGQTFNHRSGYTDKEMFYEYLVLRFGTDLVENLIEPKESTRMAADTL